MSKEEECKACHWEGNTQTTFCPECGFDELIPIDKEDV